MASLLDLLGGLNDSERRNRQRQLDYWREREEEQKKHNITDLEEYNRELDKIYATMINDCQNQINDWYLRYASKEGITIAEAKKRVSTADQRYYAERAKEYVANKDFSSRANTEMRLYNLTMKVNRMELLKANLSLAMTSGYNDIEKLTVDFLDKKTLEELKRQAVILGKGVDDVDKQAHRIVNASFKNASFSDRIWTDMDSLRQRVNMQVQRSLIRGLNPVEIARGFMPELRDDVGKAKYATERLARTEMSRVLTDAAKVSMKQNGYDEYMIICERSACSICRPFDGQHFPIEEMEVAENAPPFHPNCVLPETKIFAPDAEKLIRSEYLGDIVEISTSYGTRLRVTPNHIVLTARGWVRAKNLVKGDYVICDCRNVGNRTHAEPTDDDCAVSVEQLFASVIKAGGGASSTVPATSIDLKGDVIPNSKIDIVNVDGELRNKLDPSFRQCISDSDFVWTSEPLEGMLTRQSTMALLFMGIGLSSDGLMSVSGVLGALFGSETTKCKLPRFRNVSDYNARLNKTLLDGFAGDPVMIGELLDALAGFITADEIIDVNFSFYSGHVYDTSCSSTVYNSNGIISSNCLCHVASYMDRDELERIIQEIEEDRRR